ncbi:MULTISPECIES: hypothetical protein [unclassified Viridibacillus]|uniref:hypothetical protein n=1 Tax=unclassified Viridibacillus TaxID=2617942 RepID=UPI00096DA58E|nr:hypothetical protein [Viridibacillus sp. FSL H8-0123]OMC82465.1 hypothetical protein BK130_10835 [Viridibacillus sp. FSL H8-0123]
MSTKIAVICSKAFMNRLNIISHEVPHIQLDFYIYNSPEETPNLMKQVKPCDVLLLAGTLPYLYAKHLLHQWPIPWTYIKQDETMISTTILSAIAKHNVTIDRLSIDVMSSTFIQNVLHDIQFEGQLPFTQEIELSTPTKQLLTNHIALWQSRQIDLVITSIHAIYDELTALDIPVIRMLDPKSSIIRHLNESISLSQLTKFESAKAVAGIIEFNEATHNPLQTVDQLATIIHASYQQVDTCRFELFTTYGHLQNALTQNKLESFFTVSEKSVKLVFGYGESILEAQRNAQHALNYASPNAIYILTENKELQGPFPNKASTLSLQAKDPYIVLMAKETKLSPLNISKIMAFSKARQSLQFTAHDLSEHLQVTRRTTERILKKLVEHNYAKIVGEEMTYQQGRPRSLYELNFSTYN